jgi:hypothetical protein
MTSDQNHHSTIGSNDSGQVKNALSNAAGSFRKSIQEATSHLVSATEQFTAMSAALAISVEDVKAAASRARDDREATEAIQARFDRDYGNLLSLLADLQERIGALAVLGRPLASPATTKAQDRPENAPDEAQNGSKLDGAGSDWSEGDQESAGKDSKKWLGWKG